MNSIRFLILGLCAVTAYAQPSRIELISRTETPKPRVGSASYAGVPELSRDGKFVLFLSAAGNLRSEESASGALNLYLQNRQSRETILISQASDGSAANAHVEAFQFSANSRRIVFETSASNLVPNDTNNAVDVFVRDLDLNETILVSGNAAGEIVRGRSFDSSITADGNRVVFTSSASLTVNDTNSMLDIYLRDLSAGSTELISVSPNGFSTSLPSYNAFIADDGRFVAFESLPNLLGDYDSSSGRNSGMFVRDLQAQTTLRVVADVVGNFSRMQLSRNGRALVFLRSEGFFYGLMRFNPETQTIDTVAATSGNFRAMEAPISVSADGSTVAYSGPFSRFLIWRKDEPIRELSTDDEGDTIAPRNFADLCQISSDGRFVLVSSIWEYGEAVYIYDTLTESVALVPNTKMTTKLTLPPDAVINDDGSVVAFSLPAPEFQLGENPEIINVYCWDRSSNTIELASRAHSQAFENSAPRGAKISERNAISDDGKKVVFSSPDIYGSLIDTNNGSDIFIQDRTTGEIKLVSVAADGSGAANAPSFWPMISANGQVVAFYSRATNLDSPPISNRSLQLYLRDLQTGLTRMVPDNQGNLISFPPDKQFLHLSRDGRLVFWSSSFDLSSRLSDIFTFDISKPVPSRVSSSPNGNVNILPKANPAISPDGKYVAFRAGGNFGFGPSTGMYVRNLETGEFFRAPQPSFSGGQVNIGEELFFNQESTTLYYYAYPNYFLAWKLGEPDYTTLVTDAKQVAVSADARWIAFARTDSGTRTQVYLRDNLNNVETMVSSNRITLAVGNLKSSNPQITADGRFVVFQSRATNLVDNDKNFTADIFLFDRETSKLSLVSANSDGVPGNSASLRGRISPDQSAVIFQSFASDLVPHDYNDSPDIFAAYFPAPDTDRDGIDDRWETDVFKTLDHDLSTDTDHDGMTDGSEFHAGTNPQESSSRLELLQVTADASDIVRLRWTTVPGRSYLIQAATILGSEPWQTVTAPIIAASAETRFDLPGELAPGAAFYRILLAD